VIEREVHTGRQTLRPPTILSPRLVYGPGEELIRVQSRLQISHLQQLAKSGLSRAMGKQRLASGAQVLSAQQPVG
jgi:hypothetical protein